MLDITEPKPTIEESVAETKKRIAIVNETIRPKLEEFCDAVIVIGSLAFAKNYRVRKSSDIDLLILLEPKYADAVNTCNLFPDKEWTAFAVETFKNNVIQHFTLIDYIDDVKIEYHFWNKEYEYKASTLEIESISRLARAPPTGSLFHLDFYGNRHPSDRKVVPYEKGFIQEYPSFRIFDGHFVPYEPISNLLVCPEILFTKDAQLYKNIDLIWERVTQRLASETGRPIDLEKSNILLSQLHWNIPEETKRSLMLKTQKLLTLQNVEYINGANE